MTEEVEIEYDECCFRTDNALLFVIEEDEHWIPRSVIQNDDGKIITVPEWFAKERGLI